jgi:hypothetical protein
VSLFSRSYLTARKVHPTSPDSFGRDFLRDDLQGFRVGKMAEKASFELVG